MNVSEQITGKVSQIKLRIEKEYLIATSFSQSTQRFVKIWIYQVQEMQVPVKYLEKGKIVEKVRSVYDSEVFGDEVDAEMEF